MSQGATHMAIWFMRVSATICLAAIVGVVGLFGRDWYREMANDSARLAAQERVTLLGGSMIWEEIGNDYIIALERSEITDAQLVELVTLLQPLARGSSSSANVPQQFAFNLAGTKIGDDGMQAISTLPVSWLNLDGTLITDDGILHMRNQQQMTIMTVGGTKVTRPGVEAIRGSLPHVWIPIVSHGRPRPTSDEQSSP